MSAYANLAFECRDHMARRDNAVEVVGAEVVVQGAALRNVEGRVKTFEGHLRSVEGRVTTIEKRLGVRDAKSIPNLPPMRPELGSHSDLARAVSQTVAKRIDAEIKNKSTPPPTTDTIAKIAEETVQTALTRIKAESWDRVEEERKAAERDRLTDRRRLRTVVIVTTITTLGAIIAALVEHFAK
jgi:hypothetical protein